MKGSTPCSPPLPTHTQRTSTRPSRHAYQSVAYLLNSLVSILSGKFHPEIGSFVADFPIVQKVWIPFLRKSEPVITDGQPAGIYDAKSVTTRGVAVLRLCGIWAGHSFHDIKCVDSDLGDFNVRLWQARIFPFAHKGTAGKLATSQCNQATTQPEDDSEIPLSHNILQYGLLWGRKSCCGLT